MKDGSFRWFLSRAYPLKDDDGNVIKWFGTATDIHASREYAEVLENEVRKRTHELKESNLSLQRSNTELQQFAHVASHDLKEPLRKIKIFTGRIANDQDNILSEQSRGYISKVNSAADRMFVMIEGVLNYSVMNASEQRIEPVSVEEIIRHIRIDLELPVASANATIRFDKLPVVEGSSVLLYQLFYNLINNSLKFAKQGVPAEISISAKTGETATEICVKDNGIGFDQQFSKKIFDSFIRLNSKDQFEGTGLGLSLCKRIAERHGGDIKAIGVPGEGASFIIILPLRQYRDSI
jgi:light-regulated signal transduction histidine kinase (bacteriophytochrome)